MKDTIVLYPFPAIGHIVAIVEFGKFMLQHNPSLTITVLIANLPHNSTATDSYINAISKTIQSFIFHYLPKNVSLSKDPSSYPNPQAIAFDLLHRNVTNVQNALQTISNSSTNVQSLIIDIFCLTPPEVAADLDIPVYYFFASGAALLATVFHFPTLHHNTTKSFKDLTTNITIPGLPPFPATSMPRLMLDRNDEGYKLFLNFCTHLSKAGGVLVNTFRSLEPRAIRAISDELCIPDAPTPPVYYVGPLITSDDKNGGGDEGDAAAATPRHECLEWLDAQAKRSVVFLCFGSLGLFSVVQLHEIAAGLEKSGHRFLWVVRNPPVKDKNGKVSPVQVDWSLESLMPEGFLDRTKDRGLVVKSWVPQMPVLSHESIGGFVTHCGWNSVLEALCSGVPLVAWPLYAEQRLNRVLLVNEMKLAMPMEESQDGLVKADEVEKRVKALMDSDSEEGKELGKRCLAMKECAKNARNKDGSSHVALAELAELWVKTG